MNDLTAFVLAGGKSARMGSDKAEPKAPGDQSPMVYTRLNDAGTAFEAERNLITTAVGLDGGGSLAADDKGNVYVAWHAPAPDAKGEANRRVWVARSTDEGQTFTAEKPAFKEPTGACGCCGMRAFADHKGNVYMLYRSATDQVHRDIYLLTSTGQAADFQGLNLHPWEISTCPMSSMAFAEGPAGVLAAWETNGQVYWTAIDPATGKTGDPVAPPGQVNGRKHPVVAANAHGETILAWTEGMGWERGGSVAWHVYDRDGKPEILFVAGGNLVAIRGADCVEEWSKPAGLGNPKYAPCPLLRQYVQAGRLGRKSGRGFYDYG